MSRALVSNGGGRLLLAVIFMFQVASALQAASINLAWDANTEPLAGYNIYRSTQSGVFTSGPLNGSAPLNTTSFSDSTVSSGTYYYVIKAVGTDGIESGSSNQVQATVASVNSSPTSQPLVEPSGLAAQCNDGRTFTVSWNPVVGAENYYLRVDYVANNANGNWYITDEWTTAWTHMPALPLRALSSRDRDISGGCMAPMPQPESVPHPRVISCAATRRRPPCP